MYDLGPMLEVNKITNKEANQIQFNKHNSRDVMFKRSIVV